MNHLGIVFSFISKDADNKINILLDFLKGENKEHYVTIQSMVGYELDNGLVDLDIRDKHPESGCWTLLRLHRALHWLHLFLERLKDSDEDSQPSVMCSEAYSETLAQHHDWIIRKAGGVAFGLLPGRETFFKVMNAGSMEQVVAMLAETLPLISKVYEITEDLYEANNLLKLP